MEREVKTSLQWSNLLVLFKNVSCSCNGIARPVGKNVTINHVQMKQISEFLFTSAKDRKRAEDLMQHPESLLLSTASVTPSKWCLC